MTAVSGFDKNLYYLALQKKDTQYGQHKPDENASSNSRFASL